MENKKANNESRYIRQVKKNAERGFTGTDLVLYGHQALKLVDLGFWVNPAPKVENLKTWRHYHVSCLKAKSGTFAYEFRMIAERRHKEEERKRYRRTCRNKARKNKVIMQMESMKAHFDPGAFDSEEESLFFDDMS